MGSEKEKDVTPEIKCGQCNQWLAESELIQHLVTVHGWVVATPTIKDSTEIELLNKCPYCSNSIRGKVRLENHMLHRCPLRPNSKGMIKEASSAPTATGKSSSRKRRAKKAGLVQGFCTRCETRGLVDPTRNICKKCASKLSIKTECTDTKLSEEYKEHCKDQDNSKQTGKFGVPQDKRRNRYGPTTPDEHGRLGYRSK